MNDVPLPEETHTVSHRDMFLFAGSPIPEPQFSSEGGKVRVIMKPVVVDSPILVDLV